MFDCLKKVIIHATLIWIWQNIRYENIDITKILVVHNSVQSRYVLLSLNIIILEIMHIALQALKIPQSRHEI